MRRTARVGFLSLLACTTIGGCLTTPSPNAPAKAGEASVTMAGPTDASVGRISELNKGYALLLDLLKDEARVSQILAIKNASPGVRSLLKRISSTASANRDEIDKLLGETPALAPTGLGLPSIEVAARDRIAEDQTSVLLTSSGETFALRILLTQDRASGYASALASSLANLDPNVARRDLCKAIARDWGVLGDDVRQHLRHLGGAKPATKKATKLVPGTPSP